MTSTQVLNWNIPSSSEAPCRLLPISSYCLPGPWRIRLSAVAVSGFSTGPADALLGGSPPVQPPGLASLPRHCQHCLPVSPSFLWDPPQEILNLLTLRNGGIATS